LYVQSASRFNATSDSTTLAVIEALCATVARHAKSSVKSAAAMTESVLPWLMQEGGSEQEISNRPSGLSLKTNLEGVCIPSQVATVETPAVRKGSQPSYLSFGRGFKPELVLRSKRKIFA
jgi:hypothetical protein